MCAAPLLVPPGKPHASPLVCLSAGSVSRLGGSGDRDRAAPSASQCPGHPQGRKAGSPLGLPGDPAPPLPPAVRDLRDPHCRAGYSRRSGDRGGDRWTILKNTSGEFASSTARSGTPSRPRSRAILQNHLGALATPTFPPGRSSPCGRAKRIRTRTPSPFGSTTSLVGRAWSRFSPCTRPVSYTHLRAHET